MKFRALKELDTTEGTVQLVERGDGTHAHLSGTDIVLVPQPSDDPNDPLRWPQWKKYLAFILVCNFAFLNSWTIGGLSQAFLILSKDFNESVSNTAGLLSYCILVLGLGNFFWVPTALYFGKRPVFVVASLIYFVCIIWSAAAQSFGSLLGARIVAAFAGGSTEALGAAIVNDLFFLHERGSKMGYYVVWLSSGNALGPLCAGFIVTAIGWRWFNWICAIACGVNFVAVVLFVPETRFNRMFIQESGDPVPTSAATDEKGVPMQSEVEDVQMSSPSPTRTYSRKKTFLQELNIWSGVPKDNSYLSYFIRPFPMIAYPAVIWAILSYSISLAATVSINSLNTFVLQAPPYNFTPAQNGLLNIPALIGTLFGAFAGGYLTDVYATWRARKHGGIFVPESRLVLLITPGILVPMGLLMFGFGAGKQLHWIVIFLGVGFANVGVTGVANIGMLYVMDTYFLIAPEQLLLINGLKNVVAFGYSYGVVPWVVSSGYEKASPPNDLPAGFL